jgi:hypothetical protein
MRNPSFQRRRGQTGNLSNRKFCKLPATFGKPMHQTDYYVRYTP